MSTNINITSAAVISVATGDGVVDATDEMAVTDEASSSTATAVRFNMFYSFPLFVVVSVCCSFLCL